MRKAASSICSSCCKFAIRWLLIRFNSASSRGFSLRTFRPLCILCIFSAALVSSSASLCSVASSFSRLLISWSSLESLPLFKASSCIWSFFVVCSAAILMNLSLFCAESQRHSDCSFLFLTERPRCMACTRMAAAS